VEIGFSDATYKAARLATPPPSPWEHIDTTMPHSPRDIHLLGSRDTGESKPIKDDCQSFSGLDVVDERAARIRVKNRRKMYLDRHPEYFSPSLELAGLLMYRRLYVFSLFTNAMVQIRFSMIAAFDVSRALQSEKQKAGKKAIPVF
jgi:hypothetical protein